DLTGDIARERGLELDSAGFEREMQAQRERARAAGGFRVDYTKQMEIAESSEFVGYEHLAVRATVRALYREDRAVERLGAGEEGLVILDRTPFYAESGGQVGDRGTIRGTDALFEVRDTRKHGAAPAHLGRVRTGGLAVGEEVEARVDEVRRAATRLNHSATHLLHAALRQVLGEHVRQKGSLVTPDRLRFDFSHSEALTAQQIAGIERLVNREIRANLEVTTRILPFREAIAAGALAFFEDKYGDEVRVLSMGEFSTELCGGTHVARTGDIGLFKIVAESGVASGVRRVEAVTGEAAVARVEESEAILAGVGGLLKAGREEIVERVGQLVQRTRAMEKELDRLQARLASQRGGQLADQATDFGGVRVLAARLDGADAKTLRETVDQLKSKLGSAAVVLGAVEEGKVRLVAGVTRDLIDRVRAGDLVNVVAERVGGKGGGRADLAQAGGNRPEALDPALAAVPGWVHERLKA
ncbi:MAG TPA: alanine--tRNA ligase, partial [Chromatiales bacterium]|nr:alanine--tRNA ligase [Chromatiales bacterium]